MGILAIILLIVLGILLFLVEFLIIPGITIAGIGGFILIGGGIYAAYHFHGVQTGNFVLLGTVLLIIITFYLMFRSRTWKKIMLDRNIDSTVENIKTEDKIKIGDTGKSITRLNPIGKAMVNGIMVEAKCITGFLDQNTEIIVTKVRNTNIEVKPKN